MYDTANPFADGFVWAVHVLAMPVLWVFAYGVIAAKGSKLWPKVVVMLLLLALVTLLSATVRHLAYFPERLRVELMMPELTQRALEQRKLLEGK